jgi:hypothetical protein
MKNLLPNPLPGLTSCGGTQVHVVMIRQDNTATHQRARNRDNRNVGTRRAKLSSGNFIFKFHPWFPVVTKGI